MNRRILIIDDNRAIHDDYRKILFVSKNSNELDDFSAELFGTAIPEKALADFEIESAHQGQEGFAAVQKSLDENRPYAMAFVDMRMPPGWDGLETIQHIWNIDPHLQIVICSAFSDHSWSELIEKLEHDASWLLLRKPFDSAEVSQLAHSLTHKWDLERKSRMKIEQLELALAKTETSN